MWTVDQLKGIPGVCSLRTRIDAVILPPRALCAGLAERSPLGRLCKS